MEGVSLNTASIRVLVVDDYEPWRRFVCSTCQRFPQLRLLGEASDGLEALQKAQELQPDLIVLDIGLPHLNGIQAARRIREASPKSKILFVSENRSLDIVEEALSTGAGGYVVKSDAGNDLWLAVEAVLQGERFVSVSLSGYDLVHSTVDQADNAPLRERVVAPFRAQKNHRHEVEFYADDGEFVDGFARFIETALTAGSPVVVVATDSHEASLRQRLVADGFNVAAEIEKGSYIPLNVADTLSRFVVHDSLDPILFKKLAEHLITEAARGAKGKHGRVSACGEGVHALLATGNSEATIMLERMWDEIAQHYDVDILCGYFRSAFASKESSSTLERVCAEHTAVHGKEMFLLG